MDPGESPQETVVREVLEETGLNARPVCIIDAFSRKPSAVNGPHHVISVVYYCEVLGGTLLLSDEGIDLKYWRIEDVPVWHRDHDRFAIKALDYWKNRTQI